MESPVLIDLWTVDPSRRDELLERISDNMRNVVAGHPGFVSAQIYQSIDGDVVLLSVRMRTIEERQRLTDSPEAHRALRELRAIAHMHARLYRLVESFGAADSAI
jgi:antibiotic biosynthesis monooxygenase